MGDEKRDDLIREGWELMSRITDVANEASKITLRVRVDRLLESATPGLGWKFDRYMIEAYENSVASGMPKDMFWERFFASNAGEFRVCGCPRRRVAPIPDSCPCDECLSRERECELDEFEEDSLEEFFGVGGYSYPNTESPNNRDVYEDPTMWLAPRLEYLRPEYGPPEPPRHVNLNIELDDVPYAWQMRVYSYAESRDGGPWQSMTIQ